MSKIFCELPKYVFVVYLFVWMITIFLMWNTFCYKFGDSGSSLNCIQTQDKSLTMDTLIGD